MKKTSKSSAKLAVPMVSLVLTLTACSDGNNNNLISESAPTSTEPVVTEADHEPAILDPITLEPINPDPLNTDPLSENFENDPPIAQIESLLINRRNFPGDEITLAGSSSRDFDGTIASYNWTQISGAQEVSLSSPDEANTTFIAPLSLVSETYVFQLEVIDDKSASDTATVSVTIEPSVTCVSCTPNQINTLYESGNIKDERHGQLAAIDGAVLAVANQVSNKIEFHDLASGIKQKEIQLNSAPDQLYFQSNRRLLYVSLVGSTVIAQVNVDSDQTQTFQISGLVESMTGGNDRVYYTLQNQFTDYNLYSLDPDGNEQSHGPISENLVAYNATLNEIINANSNSSSGQLYRYGFTESGQLEQRQSASTDPNNFFGPVPSAQNISISSNGQQMAIASAAGGNSSNIPIQDIPPGNIQISNGAWISDGFINWVEFSANDQHIITVHESFDQGAVVNTVFDATSKVRLFEKALSSPCPNSFDIPEQTGFTNDNQYFYAKISCGFDDKNSVISYSKFPQF